MAIALQREKRLNGSLWRALFAKLKIPRISARSFRLLLALADLTLNARRCRRPRIGLIIRIHAVIIPHRPRSPQATIPRTHARACVLETGHARLSITRRSRADRCFQLEILT